MNHFTEPTTQTARKTHRCTWCWQLIEPGEEYKRYRHFDNGEARTEKLHPECYEAMLGEVTEWGGHIEWTPGQERPEKKEQQ
jgi:hypothetical protein